MCRSLLTVGLPLIKASRITTGKSPVRNCDRASLTSESPVIQTQSTVAGPWLVPVVRAGVSLT